MGYTKADFPASLFSGNTRKWIILLRQSKELTQTGVSTARAAFLCGL